MHRLVPDALRLLGTLGLLLNMGHIRWPILLSSCRLVRMMRNAMSLFFASVFAVQSLTAPFWIRCHSTGPNPHDRVELVFDSCCSCCKERATQPVVNGRVPSPASDANDCDACQDEKLDQSAVVHPVQVACPDLLCAVLPTAPILPIAFRLPPQEQAFFPGHSSDPPLFLTHCNFRI